MAVAWYGVKCWLLTSPDESTRIIGTRPTHSWTWEMWTVDKRDGSTVQIPQRVRRKYQGYAMSPAYNSEYVEGDETSIPTVALLRVEYPDDGTPPIQAADYEVLLDTQNKWNQVYTLYPTLKYRFLDQPYFPYPPPE